MKRAIIIVLDSVGIGEMPDADKFNDNGMDTLGNISRYFEDGLKLPNMGNFGLGNIAPLKGIPPSIAPGASYGKCSEASPAKDTTIGHWEIAGIISKQAFPTYPNGFPPEVLDKFTSAIGIGILGNFPASGTEILKDLGDEHVATKKPIVYTSGDSVFQIACHEEIYPPEKLYEMCRIARNILQGKHAVGRVIARPFIGKSGEYKRTTNRQDFALPAPKETILDILKKENIKTIGIGKIGDIFNHTGLVEEIHQKSNAEGIQHTIDKIKEENSPSFIFTNLVDFDMLYGHRNDPAGYKKALEEFDSYMPEIVSSLKDEDILILTADHGCDPTITRSTDHSREYVPLLVYSKKIKQGVNLGIRTSFADIGKTVLDYLIPDKKEQIESIDGLSFLKEIIG